MALKLVIPAEVHLPDYVSALRRGWSPDPVGGAAAAAGELDRIAEDPSGFLAALDDRDARGEPVALPDGSRVQRLPGFRRWMWDDGFCGSISFRWSRPGSTELPAHVLGHVGYAVPPWKRGHGYAAQALRLLLPEARALGLAWIELTTTPDNIASQRVIQAVGGERVEIFEKPAAYGGGEAQRWRVRL